MTRRKCPKCDQDWYSAVSSGSWICENCGAEIREENELPLSEGREEK